MAVMEPVSYAARDGLTIHGYLTLPAGREPKGLPLVIMPHGGPYGIRDEWGFNLDVQFLANRGYAVLQPNYRGSTGYGADFIKAGSRRMGPQDAGRSRRRHGLAGQRRASSIPSGSAWSAAPMAAMRRSGAATRNPERYRCAVCYAGVFDLRKQIGYAPELFASKNDTEFLDYVRGTGAFNLDTVSPLRRSIGCRCRSFWSTAKTTMSCRSSSRRYDAALKHAGKPHEFYTITNEVTASIEKDSFAFYLTKLDAFLAAHNPA